jgi:hypothetical protein
MTNISLFLATVKKAIMDGDVEWNKVSVRGEKNVAHS